MPIQKDKLTESQKQELERIRNFVGRARLNSQMNGTKWRAAINAILALEGYRPAFRFKAVMAAADAPVTDWDEGFPDHVPLYNSMEWLELKAGSAGVPAKDRRGDFREAIKLALAAAGIPIAESEEGVRILAYTRPGGSQPRISGPAK